MKGGRPVHYSSGVPSTRWGEAITRLLSERGWTKRQLAEAATVRPNTLTNLIKHGRDSDTATLARIAAALEVDIAELFMSREQSLVLSTYRESRVERLRDLVVKELSETVTRLVTQEMERGEEFPKSESVVVKAERPQVRSTRKRGRAKATKKSG